MARITAGKIIKIAVLPGIIPRTRDLMSGNFGNVSFYIAQLFRAVRLLPFGHPYLSPANFGRFGISHVTAEAWRTIVRGRCQMDQVLIFLMVLLGLGILFVQFCFLGMMLFVQTADALPALPAGGFFNTVNPTEDLAFILMDSVFGLPDFFGSCVEQGIVCFAANPTPHPAMPYPLPYHEGLRAMLMVYSIGLLAIAMIIFSYFVVTVLIETSEHGTPFGKRFNHLWAPIRMVVALALLIPIANGLNAAQYLVMYAAKWGSGFATTGWNLFLTDATATGDTLLGDANYLIAIPNSPPANIFLEFATVVAACKVGDASGVDPRDVQAYVIFPDQIGPASRANLVGLPFITAYTQSNFGDIHYVFGVYDQDASGNPLYGDYPGQVRPVCGELVLQITDVDDANSPGSQYILSEYHRLVTLMWDDIRGAGAWGTGMTIRQMGYGFVRRKFPRDIRWTPTSIADPQDPTYPEATVQDLAEARAFYELQIDTIITAGIALQIASPVWAQMLDYGWAGAGIWYNNVARLNGTLLDAAHALPTPIKYPEAMEYVAKQRGMFKQAGTGPERFKPELANGKVINFDPPKMHDMAQALYYAQISWDGAYTDLPGGGANPFIDAMNSIFGTQGLFELSKNTDTHPLAALVAMGKGLMDSAIRNLGASAFSGLLGGFANFTKGLEPLGKPLAAISSFTKQVAMISLSIGFLLFYVLPFIPFLYFFFAVGGWVKGIFESMVAVPLWALAHIRIDGESMPGDAAKPGYFMIFEIFLRPILIVFGMLAGITIFAAQVKVLNEIWPLVTSNINGFNATSAKTITLGEVGSLTYYRGVLDQFVYTVIYAVVVYMMGMASFKLIDMLPNNILRWLGSDVSGFSDQTSNGPEGLMMRMNIGAQMVTDKVGSLGGSLGGLGKQGISAIKGGSPGP